MIDYKRQIAMFDPSKHEAARVVVVGCGNIGSHSALALARMGVQNITLVDFDTVEGHNLSSQAFRYGDIGREKVEALAEMILQITPQIQITLSNRSYQDSNIKIDENTTLVSAVDSMRTRKAISEMVKDSGCLVVDGRMGGGQIEVHTQRADAWGATLVDEADSDPCGARYISYTSYIIAGLIANNVKRHLQGEAYPYRILMHCDTLELIRHYPHATKT